MKLDEFQRQLRLIYANSTNDVERNAARFELVECALIELLAEQEAA